ncbi:MAG: 50S ribosomal protein L3 [Candidatus Krumholzibacteria bacterium]|nr:50S ribosomal protein L3 [Candidatus Krumholzibacteria bacterium]
MQGLIGRKIGMTNIFDKDGAEVPVSVIELGPCPVVQVKTPKKEKYGAVQLGFGPVRATKTNLATVGHFKKASLPAYKHLQEFRVDNADEFKPGQMIDVSIFNGVEWVDVTGKTKGRGFTGLVKRHKFHGGDETHGSKSHAVAGSIGSSAYPSRVMKGKRMAGRMGYQRFTVRNLKVVEIDLEHNLLMVRGAVPGAANTILRVTASS